jgi:hypothetical protein
MLRDCISRLSKESRPIEDPRFMAGEGPGFELPLEGDWFERPKME